MLCSGHRLPWLPLPLPPQKLVSKVTSLIHPAPRQAKSIPVVSAALTCALTRRRRKQTWTCASAEGVELPSKYSAKGVAEACGGDVWSVAQRLWQILCRLWGWLCLEPFSDTKPSADAAAELRRALVDLGPSFVKVGQLLSSRVDLLPSESLEGWEAFKLLDVHGGDSGRAKGGNFPGGNIQFLDHRKPHGSMEFWEWASLRCCQRRRVRPALPGAPLSYVASLQPGADALEVAEWKRRFSCGHWEILEGRLCEEKVFRTAKAVPAGCPLLFETSSASATLGPKACMEMTKQLEMHQRKSEVLQLPGDRFTVTTNLTARICRQNFLLGITCSPLLPPMLVFVVESPTSWPCL
eukprot:symbB.v1.2.025496.t1/scaffold2479.1/size78191/2